MFFDIPMYYLPAIELLVSLLSDTNIAASYQHKVLSAQCGGGLVIDLYLSIEESRINDFLEVLNLVEADFGAKLPLARLEVSWQV